MRVKVLGEDQEVREYCYGKSKKSLRKSFEEKHALRVKGTMMCPGSGVGEGLGKGMCFEIPELSLQVSRMAEEYGDY
jgi:hypothetical protein